MYRVDRNNFYTNGKDATVYTPDGVSEFLFDILSPCINGLVLDPCVGAGSLLRPFIDGGYETLGIDIEDQGHKNTQIKNFLAVERQDVPQPALVIANPPFNIDEKTKELAASVLGRRPLLPEVWLQKIIYLWGKDVPICLFAPYGLRLNLTTNSRRWRAFCDGAYPEISSIVALPKDIYQNVMFHSEILIFNVHSIKPHYFYDDQKCPHLIS